MPVTELARQSIALDRRFLKVSRWSLSKKLRFLYRKYQSIGVHFFRPFNLGKSNIRFDGRDLYYDSKLGLAGYQSMLSRHQNMLQIADVKPSTIKNVIDCGANVGFFSLMVHDVFPLAKIYTIEPVPQVRHCLEKNTDLIAKIVVSDSAISDKIGTAFMSFDENDSVVSHLASTGSIKVNTITLDKYCESKGIVEIDILKIDTETFEAHVLRGAKNTLAHTRYLFLEITIKDNHNYTLSYIMSLLYSDKYDFQLVAYRNYSNRGEGVMDIMDCLLLNQKYASARNQK